jgi:hypothetical protein
MSLAMLRKVLPLIVLLPVLAQAAEQPATAPADAAQWVSKLNSEDFDERTNASAKLAAMGETAREALEKGAAGTDPDIRSAAAELLGKLSQATLTVLTTNRDGKPLAGIQADLTIYKDVNNGNQQVVPITTKEDGTALLTTCEPGTYNAYAAWKKCAPASNAYAVYTNRFKLLSGPNRFNQIVSEGGSCEAAAVDADGKVLKDARIFLCPTLDVGESIDDPTFPNRFGASQHSQSTDEHGKAKIENIPDGVYRVIWSHDSAEATLGPVIRIREKQETQVPPVTLKPKSRGIVQLTLTKDDDKPLEKMHFYYSLMPDAADAAAQRRAIRQEYQQHMNNNGQALQSTDEHGKVTLENLKTGKYHLLLRTTNADNNQVRMFRGNGNDQTESMSEYAGDIEVKAGATTELTLKPSAGSVLKGRILNEKGEGFRDITLALIDERYLAITGTQIFTQNYYDPAGMYTRYSQNKQDGTFELPHLRPGKYALSVRARSGESALVYGVEILDGKPTELPEIKLGNYKPVVTELKGKVMLPNAVPGASATVYLETLSPFGNSSSGMNTNQKGEFTFSSAYFSTGNRPNRLKVTLAGYHAVTVDLNNTELKADDMVINLVKRDYGKLCVKTVDEAGKPMAGVKVWPVPSNPWWFYNNRQNVSRMQRSNAAGEVHFTGLADGSRKMQVEREGYFVDADIAATVHPGEEESVFTAVLHTGLKIDGQLELPKDVSAAEAGVALLDHQSTAIWTTVKPGGQFEFSGLRPGTYTLHTVLPGCSPAEVLAPIVLTPDLKAPLTIKAKMLRNGGVAISAGPESAGKTAHLLPVDLLKSDRADQIWSYLTNPGTDLLDNTGRAEFSVPAGPYHVLLSDPVNYYDGAYNYFNYVNIMTLAGTATAEPLDSVAGLSKLKDQPISLPKNSASVSVTLLPENPKDVPQNKLRQIVNFLVLGDNAVATFYFNRQQWQQTAPTPVIIGTPPPELASRKENRYTVEHFPPGHYRLLMIGQTRNGKGAAAAGEPKLISEFTLSEDQKLDLGTLNFTVPAASPEELDQNQTDYFGFDGTDDDKVELFKP